MWLDGNKIERSFNSDDFDVIISHGDPKEKLTNHYVSICTGNSRVFDEHFAINVNEIPAFIKLLQETMSDFKLDK